MMIEKRHEILEEIISKYEDAETCSCFSDLQRVFVKTLCLLGECIGYIDAVNGGMLAPCSRIIDRDKYDTLITLLRGGEEE